MKTNPLPYRLLAPGPVPVPPAVLKVMSEKVLHHRTPAFEKILQETWQGLKYVFQTQEPVMMIAGTGSSAMEAAVVNCLSPGDPVLVIVSGKFGERWAEICNRYQLNVDQWKLPWGAPATVDGLKERIEQSNAKYKAIFCQVCETSTATLHPIEELAKVIRQKSPQTLFMLDAITALGCTPLKMDEWDLDVVVGGSQKAFMIPTGLSFVALSKRAWQAQKQSKISKFYFDLELELKANQKGDTHFSSPTPLISGLRLVLEKMQSRGLEAIIDRCQALANYTQQAGAHLGMPIYSKNPSPSVTALLTPTDSHQLREWLEREKNITIMGGQDQLKGKILRVGHMGDIQNEDMIALFQALAEALKQATPEMSEKFKSLGKTLQKTAPLFS